MRDRLEERFAHVAEEAGIPFREEWMALFEKYYEKVVEANQTVNLTAITEREDVFWKHFFDSLTVLACPGVPDAGSVVDVGTGAGFPGLVLAIARPGFDVVLLDSLQKRVRFLETVVGELGLDGVRVVHGRAETVGQSAGWRENFDVATARAVARLNVLAELLLPLVRLGGVAVAWKGPGVEEEVQEAQRALRELGGEIEHIHWCTLPEGRGERALVVIRKVATTPKKYPRKPGLPQKRPLV
ncbi:MAG: 16S rRNA (guanine(527)-N(7))-methyltransferase RsmG [Alicyclobacillaceae bacterium]|nr:16S rRNA (guanine(527)-N(7))-methyltransferase RsmG [Alicyclobacillaceae bacterium]